MQKHSLQTKIPELLWVLSRGQDTADPINAVQAAHTHTHTHPSCFPACISYSPGCPCQWTWIRGPGGARRGGSLMNTMSVLLEMHLRKEANNQWFCIISFNKPSLSFITRPLRKLHLDLSTTRQAGEAEDSPTVACQLQIFRILKHNCRLLQLCLYFRLNPSWSIIRSQHYD